MKTLPISYFDLSICLKDLRRQDFVYYLDTQTGEIIELNQKLYNEWANETEVSTDDLLEWQQKDLVEMIQVFQDRENRYLEVPTLKMGEQLEIMNQFIQTVHDQNITNELSEALKHRKAVKTFNQVLKRHSAIQGAYDRFEENAHRKLLEDWLAGIGIDPQWQ